jgi:hypothetical protein
MNRLAAFVVVCATTPFSFAQALKYEKKSLSIPMRDGAKLTTFVQSPVDAKESLPFLIVRTPYGADGRFNANSELGKEGYHFVFQDCRGRFGSEGDFSMMSAGVKKGPNGTDDATDAYDTIDWLVKNIPNNNGRAGIYGVSYPGWTAAMALIDPHPALKASSPQSSPIDQWMGDDFHHHGAFRLSYGFDYTHMMESSKVNAGTYAYDRYDTYEFFLKAGSLKSINEKAFKGKMPTWNRFVNNPNYDSFWQNASLSPRLTKTTVPTLNVTGWFDQEDFRGPLKIYEQLEANDAAKINWLVVGPWNHGGWSGPGSRYGRLNFGSATGTYFREKVQATFFAAHLKDKGSKERPEAELFQTGKNVWSKFDAWPPKEAVVKSLYFGPNGKLTFDAPTADGQDTYRSDPAKPVPYRPRPIRPTYGTGSTWSQWMGDDQRFTADRPDVLTYVSEPLTEDLVIAGSMTATLFGSTTGSDCDWVVRLIDVFPEGGSDPTMAGFQMLIAGEPVRARFRKSYEKPEAVVPGQVEEYGVPLYWGHHNFQKGHRVMVQVSSSWFPLIDRNPQKFVPNIYLADDADFVAADQTVHRSPKAPSRMELQILPAK